jgi:hypothetical protein
MIGGRGARWFRAVAPTMREGESASAGVISAPFSLWEKGWRDEGLNHGPICFFSKARERATESAKGAQSKNLGHRPRERVALSIISRNAAK